MRSRSRLNALMRAVALERVGMTLDGAAPPLEHRFAGLGSLRDRAVDAALEQRRRRAVVVLEEQRLAEGHQEIDVVAGIEIRHAHGAERDARRRQIVGVGALAIALEMGARQDDGRSVGGGRLPSAPPSAASIASSNWRWL